MINNLSRICIIRHLKHNYFYPFHYFVNVLSKASTSQNHSIHYYVQCLIFTIYIDDKRFSPCLRLMQSTSNAT